jgi:hypothetical protein
MYTTWQNQYRDLEAFGRELLLPPESAPAAAVRME